MVLNTKIKTVVHVPKKSILLSEIRKKTIVF